ncbi:MAG: biopolymer transporter ExbD [Planctomycetes bacterium]|nr:biopolymer transporter ExbD [Planctomycetota bacterium]
MGEKRKAAKRAGSTEMAIDFTPIIDCGFNLLIFFMCTLQFSTLEGQFSGELPKDQGPGPVGPRLERLRIEIEYDSATDRAFFRAASRRFDDVALLLPVVRNFVGRSPDLPVEISPLGDVPYRFVVEVLDVCGQAEAPQVQFSQVGACVR